MKGLQQWVRFNMLTFFLHLAPTKSRCHSNTMPDKGSRLFGWTQYSRDTGGSVVRRALFGVQRTIGTPRRFVGFLLALGALGISTLSLALKAIDCKAVLHCSNTSWMTPCWLFGINLVVS